MKAGQQFFAQHVKNNFFPFMDMFVALVMNGKNLPDASRIICGIIGFALPAIRYR